MNAARKLRLAAKRTIRFLLEEPGAGWCNYPLRRGLAPYHDALRLPSFASQTLRIAFAHLVRGDDGIYVLDRLEVNSWQLDASGVVDQVKIMEDIIKRMEPAEGPLDFSLLATVPVNNLDIRAICRCIGVSTPPRFR